MIAKNAEKKKKTNLTIPLYLQAGLQQVGFKLLSDHAHLVEGRLGWLVPPDLHEHLTGARHLSLLRATFFRCLHIRAHSGEIAIGDNRQHLVGGWDAGRGADGAVPPLIEHQDVVDLSAAIREAQTGFSALRAPWRLHNLLRAKKKITASSLFEWFKIPSIYLHSHNMITCF